MALPAKKRATAPAKKPEAEASDENVITSVTVARGFKLGGSDYSSGNCFVSVAALTYADASAAVDEYLALEIEKLGEGAQALGIDLTGEGSGGGSSDEGDEEGDGLDGGEEGASEEGITAEDIAGMKRDAIVSLIEENGLETDPDGFPKNAKGLAALREAVIAEAFPDEGEEGGDEGEAEEDDGAEEGDGEETISEEDIKAMDRSELVAFISENEIDVNPKKYPKLPALAKAVIEALGSEEDGEGEEPEEEAEEDGEDDADDAGEGYTEADLKKATVKELKALWADWEIPGKFPPGPDAVAKKNAIKKILAFQSE